MSQPSAFNAFVALVSMAIALAHLDGNTHIFWLAINAISLGIEIGIYICLRPRLKDRAGVTA